jgi:hypothetical protein
MLVGRPVDRPAPDGGDRDRLFPCGKADTDGDPGRADLVAGFEPGAPAARLCPQIRCGRRGGDLHLAHPVGDSSVSDRVVVMKDGKVVADRAARIRRNRSRAGDGQRRAGRGGAQGGASRRKDRSAGAEGRRARGQRHRPGRPSRRDRRAGGSGRAWPDHASGRCLSGPQRRLDGATDPPSRVRGGRPQCRRRLPDLEHPVQYEPGAVARHHPQVPGAPRRRGRDRPAGANGSASAPTIWTIQSSRCPAATSRNACSPVRSPRARRSC